MANDTDNNFLVTGATQNANIATDYSSSDAAHISSKVSFGDVMSRTRVTTFDGLPWLWFPRRHQCHKAFTNPVTVNGSRRL